ncbi:MAG: C4-dicarboxylate transporter [Bradyrhizobium sp.]|jgi:TRAP-type C4-dicarboxylate transport system permease small subunit|nr:C4-dicarboxylate transporter [Bradyrhizobium sp.]
MADVLEIGKSDAVAPGPPSFFGRILNAIDAGLVVACTLATIGAGLVLSYSVFVRSYFHWSTDWQDEISVFLLVAATFLSAPYVQSVRGHIAIEAIRGFLSPKANRIRVVLVDTVCVLFVGIFTWQSWLLFLEAIESGEVTDSAWAPPLWIPYSFMTIGMTLLTLRMLVQLGQGLTSFGREAS